MVQQALPSMIDVSNHVNAVTPATVVQRQRIPRDVIRDSQSRTSNVGKPGSRRYQRYLNKSYLQEQIWDLQVDDFSIRVPTSMSPFTCLFEGGNMDKWSPYVETTEEKQSRLLDGLQSQRKRAKRENMQQETRTQVFIKTEVESGATEFDDFVIVKSDLEDFEEIGAPSVQIKVEPMDQDMPSLETGRKRVVEEKPAPVLFQKVDRKIRRVIQKDLCKPILESLEGRIIEFVQSNSNDSISFRLEESFQRMICYGICQFYALKIRNGKNTILVDKPRRLIVPSEPLTQFLATYTAEE